MNIKIASVLLILLFSISVNLAQEPIAVKDRKDLLGAYGQAYWKNPPIALPVNADPSSVQSTKIRASDFDVEDTNQISLHFKVESTEPHPNFLIQILNNNNKIVWFYAPGADGSDSFWSTEIQGKEATVQVFTNSENKSLKISVDGITAAYPKPTIPTATFGVPNYKKWVDVKEPTTLELGKAVARIIFRGDDGFSYPCTGFLISEDLLMTNYHCPRSVEEIASAEVNFDYDRNIPNPKAVKFKELELPSEKLDFLIIRLKEKQTDRRPLILDSTPPENLNFLRIIQHPNRRPKEITEEDCNMFGGAVPGFTADKTDFGHRCDTDGGSSGSAVISATTNKVVGLHHYSYRKGDTLEANRAVQMRLIIEYIKTTSPNLAKELNL